MSFVLLSLRVIFLVLACFSMHFFAQSPGSTIESIDIQGNRRLTDDEILKMISTRVGQTLDNEQLKKDLKSIVASGQFDPTNTKVITEPDQAHQAIVIFQVYELPIIVAVDFAGLKYISRGEIQDYLISEMPRIKPGMPYRPQSLRRCSRLIREYLQRRGFEHASVTIAEEAVSATSLSIEFRIDEIPGDDDN